MFKYLFLFICLGTSIFSFSQDIPQVHLIPNWSVGDQFNYQVTKINHKFRNEKITKVDSSTFEATLLVKKRNDLGYELSWSFVDHHFQLDKITPKKIEVNYQANAEGKYIGILQWEKLQGMLKSRIRRFGNNLLKEYDSKVVEPQLDALRLKYSTKENMEKTVLAELLSMHYSYGYELEEKEAITFLTPYPHLIKGDSIMGKVNFSLQEVDPITTSCRFRHQQQLDKEQVNQMFEEFARIHQDDIYIEEVSWTRNQAQYEIVEENDYHFDYNRGIAKEINTERTMTLNYGEDIVKERNKVMMKKLD